MFEPVDWPASDRLAARARATPDRLALVDAAADRSWSYRALSAGPVAALAAGLRAAGLEPGDHLGAAVGPGVDAAQLLFAAARAGLVFVPLPPDAPASVVSERAAVADVDAVVVAESTRRAAAEFDGPTLLLADLPDPDSASPAHRWDRGDVRWLVFTSGTTGDPRAVELTAGNLVASATASASRLGVELDDRWLACLPTHHVGGLAPFVRSALYGTTAVAQSGFDAGETAAVMDRHGVTGVSLVPTMLTRLLDDGWTPPDTLRFVLLGGAPASEALIERCEAAGVPVHPTYGATETASQIATARPGEAFAHPGTVGRPLEGVTVDVVDETGASVSAGTVGEFVVAGPVVAPGYHGAPEATAERFDDGTFHTRDRGHVDEDGRLRVVGRVDDAILTGGVTVQPDAVEAALAAHPAVAEAAVVGLDDAEWGQVVAVLVTVAGETAIDAGALRDHCRDRLDAPAVPKHVELADELPRTASGTVDRPAVVERLDAARRRGGL